MNAIKHLVSNATLQLLSSTRPCPGALGRSRTENLRSRWFQEWFDADHHELGNPQVNDQLVRLVCSWFHHKPWGGLLVLAGVPSECLGSFPKNLCRFVNTFSKEAHSEGFWVDAIPRASYFSTRQLPESTERGRTFVPESVVEDSFVVLDHFGEGTDLSPDDGCRLNYILARRCSSFTLVITRAPRSLWSQAFDDGIIFKLEAHSTVIDQANLGACNDSALRRASSCGSCYHKACEASKPASLLAHAS